MVLEEGREEIGIVKHEEKINFLANNIHWLIFLLIINKGIVMFERMFFKIIGQKFCCIYVGFVSL